MIDQSTIDRIYDAAQITEVVQDYVSLKRRGVNYLGLCPFHNEKTPSFIVSPSKGIYKCFGCGKGGNAVNFVMELETLSYYEALKHLAKKYHIDIVEKEVSPEEAAQRNERESLMIVSEFAAKFFKDTLHNHPEGKAVGLAYFKERGIRDDMIERFQLGYSPEKREALTDHALKNGFKLEYLVKSGLSIERENYAFDRFAGRVIFPIHGLSGKTIAFGGRILKTDKQTAKYLNSPESEIYHKSKVLYGIFQAKNAITRNDKCYLVEGYTDVISMHQSGVENVVASSGTALTEDQVRLIKRFTNNLTILYDGDSAGIKAATRGIDLVLEQGINVKVLLLPNDEDPDSFARKHSASELVEFIEKNETDFVLFKTRLLMGEAKKDPVKRATLISDIVKSVAIIPDAITRSVYVKECSTLLQTDENILYSEIGKIRRNKYEEKFQVRLPEAYPLPNKPQVSNKQTFDGEILEREIIRILINYGNNIIFSEQDEETKNQYIVTAGQYIISEILNDELELQHPLYKQIFDEYADHVNHSKDIDEKYFIQHPDKMVNALAADLVSKAYGLSKIWKKHEMPFETEEMKLSTMVPSIVMDFKSKKILSMIRQTQQEMLEAQQNSDIEKLEELQLRYQNLNTIKKTFASSLGNRIILH